MKDNKGKERKLSKAEEKRKEAFAQLAAGLANDGYTQKMIGISGAEMNKKAFLITIPFMLPFLILYFILGYQWDLRVVGILISIALFFVLVVVHEALHGITWAFFAKSKWRSISFGIIMESFTPYCSCNEPLKKHQIILGSLTPAILLGVGFGVAALISGSTLLLFTAFLNILGCAGDLLVVSKLLSYRSDAEHQLFIDHPYEIGTAVFEK